MPTFTPPTVAEVPPVPVADSRYGPPYADQNRPAAALFKYFKSRQRGVAIFKMSDGTYRSARPVAGLTVGLGGTVPVEEPYPPMPRVPGGGVDGQVNDALAYEWHFEQGTKFGIDGSVTQFAAGTSTVLTAPQYPTVSITYIGGVNYPVSSAEAAALTAAGFGSYIH